MLGHQIYREFPWSDGLYPLGHYRRSIGDDVRRLRIERAAQDLSDSRTSIAEIGLRTGFFDQSHISRVFRDHTGLTPAFRATARAHSRTNTQLPS